MIKPPEGKGWDLTATAYVYGSHQAARSSSRLEEKAVFSISNEDKKSGGPHTS